MTARKWLVLGLFIITVLLSGTFLLRPRGESKIDLRGVLDNKAGAVAIFRDVNGFLVINVNLNDFVGITNYSVYVIKGNCHNQGERIYHLAAIFQSKSTTTMSIKYSHLKRILPAAVIIYDDDEGGVPVYCGEIVI